MKTFVYNGGEDGTEKTDFVGVDWVRGTPVVVSHDETIARLMAHPHFDEIAADGAAVDSAADAFGDQETEDDADDGMTDAADDGEADAPVKRKGGRPKGSKNKPKVSDGDPIIG